MKHFHIITDKKYFLNVELFFEFFKILIFDQFWSSSTQKFQNPKYMLYQCTCGTCFVQILEENGAAGKVLVFGPFSLETPHIYDSKIHKKDEKFRKPTLMYLIVGGTAIFRKFYQP